MQADLQTLVGCGRALINERIAIVEPDGCRRLPADEVGEIWVNGPNVARVLLAKPRSHEDRFERPDRRGG